MWIWRPAKIIVPILKTKTLVPNQFTAVTFCVLILSTPVTEDPEIQSTWPGMSLGLVKGTSYGLCMERSNMDYLWMKINCSLKGYKVQESCEKSHKVVSIFSE